MEIKKLQTNEGLAALFTVIVVAAATLIMAFNSSLLGLGELDMGYTSQKGSEIFSMADGCIEESFRRLRLDNTYTGGSVIIGDSSCIIGVVPAGNDRTITVTASTTAGHYKKLEAGITLSTDSLPVITLNSWEEKDN